MHTHNFKDHKDNANLRIGIGIALNVVFVIVEVVFGLLSDSLALLADAGHNASDVLGLILALGANLLVWRPPDREHTYGWRRSTIMAALLNAFILLIAVGGIVREAVARFGNPGEVPGTTIIWVAGVGTIINLGTALLFRRKKDEDLNLRGAFLHMAADAGVSLGVVISGLIIRLTNAYWLDPVVSLVIAAVILWSTWGLLREAFHLEMGGVPRQIDMAEVSEMLTGIPGVTGVHDLHVWGLSTRDIALTAHLVKPGMENDDQLIKIMTGRLENKFGINHITLQIERERLDGCSAAPLYGDAVEAKQH